ncbi:hypothetical protein NPIL_439941 [Nephila pilipes]|uniref:Uncharacterized protein n=1 Tax=Nephila pilipes TaxID=299642 RepID=A0A8X6TG95_NEPPI|nr:hypothetical protein NPIL_439941 [Nephila pilipes]
MLALLVAPRLTSSRLHRLRLCTPWFLFRKTYQNTLYCLPIYASAVAFVVYKAMPKTALHRYFVISKPPFAGKPIRFGYGYLPKPYANGWLLYAFILPALQARRASKYVPSSAENTMARQTAVSNKTS